MVASLFVGVGGFIFAFIAHAKNVTPGLISFSPDVCSIANHITYCKNLSQGKNTTHFVFGLIIVLLHITNVSEYQVKYGCSLYIS